MRLYRLQAIVAVSVLGVFVISTAPVRPQEVEAEAEAAPIEATLASDADPKSAQTIQDPTVPVDQLKLLVKPLTLEELQNEAAGWLFLLKDKVEAVSNNEIAIKRELQAITAEQEAVVALEKAKTDLEAAEAAEEGTQQGSSNHEEALKKVEEARSALKDAEEKVKEALAIAEEIQRDKTLQAAKKGKGVEAAKEVLDQAKADRDNLAVGSEPYQQATQKIEQLEEAITELEKAEDELKETVPDTAEQKAATKKLEQARAAVQKARAAITGDPSEEDSAEATDVTKELKETFSELKETEKLTEKGETDKAQLDKEEQQIEDALKKLEKLSETEAEIKNQLVANVTELQSDRTAIIDRFSVVLDELERKGGDADSYRKYIAAVSVLELDIQDTEGLGVRVVGWLTSEEGGLRWLFNIIKFVLILGASIIAARFLARFLDRALNQTNTSAMFREFLVVMVKRGGIVVGLLLGLTALEVSLGPLLALLGGVSFVLAFALQSNLGNLASGLLLLINKPFDVGDEVKIAGYWAYVDSISLASTKIKDFSGNVISLPNNTVWGSDIINYTHSDIRKFDINIQVKFTQDLDQVYDMWMEITASHPKVLKDPAPGWFPWNATYDSYIWVGLRAWARTDEYWDIYIDLVKMLQKRLGELNIELVTARQDVQLTHSSPAPIIVNETTQS